MQTLPILTKFIHFRGLFRYFWVIFVNYSGNLVVISVLNRAPQKCSFLSPTDSFLHSIYQPKLWESIPIKNKHSLIQSQELFCKKTPGRNYTHKILGPACVFSKKINWIPFWPKEVQIRPKFSTECRSKSQIPLQIPPEPNFWQTTPAAIHSEKY